MSPSSSIARNSCTVRKGGLGGAAEAVEVRTFLMYDSCGCEYVLGQVSPFFFLCTQPWACVSTSGHVTMLGDPESNTKRQGKLEQEVVLENDRGQGLKINIRYSENDTDSLIGL